MAKQHFPSPYDRIYEQEVALLTTARAALSRLERVTPEDRARVEDMIEHLDQLFMLVIVGEFNSGKSSVINALLQDDFLPIGILPTTSKINILRHGNLKGSRTQDSVILLTHPAPILENMSIVDTPGTNAIFRQHEKLARDFIHRSDFILFIMAATHAFAETDRLYLELIREYGPKVVILLNQIDLLAGEREIRQVSDFIREQAVQLLQFKPDILPVSAKWATEALHTVNPGKRRKLWEESGIPVVTELFRQRLGEEARLQEKLNTPLRVTQAILSRYQVELQSQLGQLNQDFAVITTIENQEQAYQQTVEARLERKFDRVNGIFEGMAQRGSQFIDENLQIRLLTQVFNREEFQTRFEQAVIGDASTAINTQVNAIVSELLAEDRQQWETTLQALRQMLERHQDQVVGSVEGEYLGNIEAFEENVRQAEQALARYSRQDAADMMRDIQLGALGDTVISGISGLIGGIIIMTVIDDLIKALIAIQAGAAASAILGPAGWIIGGAATIGGSVWIIRQRLPRARQQAKQELTNQIGKLRATFREALRASALKEFTLFRSHVHDALLPVQQYLRQLQTELEGLQVEFNQLLQEISRLQDELDRAKEG